jgi:hypothetical protein
LKSFEVPDTFARVRVFWINEVRSTVLGEEPLVVLDSVSEEPLLGCQAKDLGISILKVFMTKQIIKNYFME